MKWGGFVKKQDSGCRGIGQSSQVTKRPDPLTSFLANGTTRFPTCFLRRPSQSRRLETKNCYFRDTLSASCWLLRLILYIPRLSTCSYLLFLEIQHIFRGHFGILLKYTYIYLHISSRVVLV